MVAAIQTLPQTGKLEVSIRVSADVNISAYAARQKANGFLLSHVGYMLHAGEPELVIGPRIVWRVPVILSQRSVGDVGLAGSIDVDVETGQINVRPAQIEEIQTRADEIARRTPSATE